MRPAALAAGQFAGWSRACAILAGHTDDDQFTEDNEFLIRIGRRHTP